MKRSFDGRAQAIILVGNPVIFFEEHHGMENIRLYRVPERQRYLLEIEL
jgi:hypothetical protein